MPSQNVYLTLPKAAQASVPWPVSDATYTRTVVIDCAAWLSYVFAVSISSVSLTAAGGLTITNLAAVGSQLQFTVAGGVNDTNDVVQMSMTTNTGQTELLTFEVPIGDPSMTGFVYATFRHGPPPIVPTGTVQPSDLTAEQQARQTADTTEAGLRSAADTAEVTSIAAEMARAQAVESSIGTFASGLYTQVSAAQAALAAKLGYVSLADFNPVGDGVADDTAAVTNAVLTAASIAAGGDNRIIEIVIGPGIYNIATPIAMTDLTTVGFNVRVTGHGMPTLRATGATGGLFAVAGKNVILENLVFDGNQAAHTGSFTAAVNIDGTGAGGCSNVAVRGCKFVNPGQGVAVTGASLVTIEKNTFANSKLHSVYLNASFDCTVSRNKMDNGGGFGVILTNGCYRNLIEGNKTLGNAIELVGVTQDSYENRIVNNHAEGTGDNGISITGYKNVVVGNICKGCMGNGIELYGERNLVVGNTCLNNAKGNASNGGWRGGIALQGGFGGISQFNTVVGNICDDDQATPTQLYGVWLGGSAYVAWANGQVITTASVGSPVYRYNSGILYKTTANGTTGATAPVHTSGTVSDGGVSWIYVRVILAGSPGTFQNEVSGNNVARFGVAKYLDTTGATGGNVNEISASFQPLVLPANLTAGLISNAGGVATLTVTNPTGYQTSAGYPISIAIAPPSISGGQQATAVVQSYTLIGFGTVATGGSGYAVGDSLAIASGTPNGQVTAIKVLSIGAGGSVATFTSNGGSFVYLTMPNSAGGVSAYNTVTGSGSGFTTTPCQFRVNSTTITAAGSGYTSAPTVTASGSSGGQPTFSATTSAQLIISAGQGNILLDGVGTHLGSNGALGGPVINEGARIEGSGVRLTMVNNGTLAIPANTSFVKLIQGSPVSVGSMTLPPTIHDGQEIRILNVGSTINSFNLPGTVTGFVNGNPLATGCAVRIIYDSSAGTWYGSVAPIPGDQAALVPGRNLLHNSAMRINQRGAASVTTTPSYAADRWVHYDSGTGSRTLSQVTINDADRTTSDESLNYAVRIQTTGATGAGDYDLFSQRIENLRLTSGKAVVVSFYAKSAVANQPLSVELQQELGSGGSPSGNVGGIGATKFLLSPVLTRYFVYVTVPSLQGKVLGTTQGTDFLELAFWTSAGTSFATRSSSLGPQTSDITITGIQLELGTTATPLERVNPTDELTKCQRFFQLIPQFLCSGYGVAGTQFYSECSMIVQMRIAPTLTTSGISYNNASAFIINAVYTNHFRMQAIITATGAGYGAGDIFLSADP